MKNIEKLKNIKKTKIQKLSNSLRENLIRRKNIRNNKVDQNRESKSK